MPVRNSTSLAAVGKTINSLTILGVGRIGKCISFQWRCVCGARGESRRGPIDGGQKKSCGCQRVVNIRAACRTHDKSTTPTYHIWGAMVQRCMNKNAVGFHRYGGRGITVCDRWLLFDNFLADMGEQPKNLSLDRVDNQKGYSPDNCKWATRKEQARNTRRNRMLTHNGKTQSLAAWAEETGIPPKVLADRVGKLKWPASLAITTPAMKRGESHYVIRPR